MEYTIKTREEFLKAYKENWRDCDFFWLSEVAPELFFDEKVADKLFSIASGDDLTDMYVIKYIPKSCWNDKEFVRTALGHNGMYLLFASEDILDDPEIAKENYNLWRLMIDKAYQNRGYGKEAVSLALEFIKSVPCGDAEYCWLSYEPDNAVARQMYRSFGFEETGEMDGEELIAVLRL